MNLDTYSRAQLARICIEEGAHHGGVNVMMAIACVLRNRVVMGWGDWLEVLRTAGEKRGHELEPAPQPANMRSGDVRIFLQRVDAVYNGQEDEDLANGAVWYTDTNYPQKRWFQEQILWGDRGDHPLLGQMNTLKFFG